MSSIPTIAFAHFSYSDPRIVHVAQQTNDSSVVLIRMPAPLVLLPDDWKVGEESTTPPYSLESEGKTILDLSTVTKSDAILRKQLNHAVELWVGNKRADTNVEGFRFWNDDERPQFGTLKSALKTFELPIDQAQITSASYFDLTLDVMISVPVNGLNKELHIRSNLGHNFPVMDKLGTVVKLHRNNNTETKAVLGVVDVTFPSTQTKWEMLYESALIGAEHIYRGLDHLAMIILIAIVASTWRKALVLASAFTLGHMITLVAGLYGFAPSVSWFIPLVELSIALSIVVAGLFIIFRRQSILSWRGLLIIGMIHGFGFAASASEVLFAGQVDVMALAAFAIGLELCQFAIYAIALPLIMLLDYSLVKFRTNWRQICALSIVVLASSSVLTRLILVSNAFS
ncbi:hypothetical protein GCM10009133_25410 [Cocleimonas flava]|uniref:Hydrogenase/urease accessory protein HupE n=1 Tax=Cocleimonas flava TaxID=634765 RepID=A0A4V2P7T8_9GAMM|nr:HupE/UreJ family protein [Cocleimonas flava]TCJ83075.1 hydrogenase/urease accessory protein HupE [Cocleimonas flava]